MTEVEKKDFTCPHCGGEEYLAAYAVLPIFDVRICKNCGEAYAQWGWLKAAIFKMFLWPFWDGGLTVEEETYED